MTWFKTDDGFYDHPKVEGLSMAARGLWLTAGTWCAKHLTDGVISAARVRTLGGTTAQIRALITHGLWVECGADVHPKSYAFHDWNDMQPSREEVLESREREREKKREWRKRKGQDQVNPENVPQGQDRGQDGGLPGVVPAPRPDPSRPDPSRPDQVIKEGRGESSRSVPRENATPPPSSDSSWLPSAIADVPPEWVQDPRSARCPKHTGVQDPPPCRGCGKAREAAEAARDERDTAEAQAAGERRAHIDACDLCDPNGLTDGHRGLIRCPHDKNALSALLSAEDHPGAPEPEPVEKTTPRALRDWRHRHANRTHTLGTETTLPAIDHDDHEPTHDAWSEDTP